MSRSLKYDIPGVDWRRGLTDAIARGRHDLFRPELEAPFDLVLEIGFGRGEFLIDLATKHPEMAYLGVEVSFKRVLKLARKLARTPLVNVRLIQGCGHEIVQSVLGPGSISECWINFSDPWPKAGHARRRLFQTEFVRDLARVLRCGGILHAATDHLPYAEQIDELLSAQSLLGNCHAPAPWLPDVPGRTATSYESEWRAEGRPLYFFDYERNADPAS